MVKPTVTCYMSLKAVLNRVMVGKFPTWTQFKKSFSPLEYLNFFKTIVRKFRLQKTAINEQLKQLQIQQCQHSHLQKVPRPF